MTTSTIDESQRKAARVAGFFYLLTFAIVVAVNFGINERLMVAGDATQTARNVLAHERLFRIGIASNLVYDSEPRTIEESRRTTPLHSRSIGRKEPLN